MRAQSEESKSEDLSAKARPIELLTENGFSISRRWEIDQVPPPANGNYHFLVRNPQNRESETFVEIPDYLVLQIELRTRGRILLSNSFWISCAERHLANYLHENDDYPPGNKLIVEYLDPEETILALRWEAR